MRLRLIVRRHGVPEVRLLWNAGGDGDLTFSKFLSQINDVLPLESDQWGLEDYAVEFRDWDSNAFECLHFQQLSHVLKEDDQVM
jgi:hypothetical protein